MDNYKIYFYVIIFIVWLFNQIRKGRKNNPVTTEVELPQNPAPKPNKSPAPLLSQNKPTKSRTEVPTARKPKPFKFDDFFDELEKSQREEPKMEKRKNIPVPMYGKVDYDNNIIDEEEAIGLKLKKDRLEAQQQNNRKVSLASSEIPTSPLKDISARNKYEEMLKNPTDLRNALILGEILNRKY